MTWQAAALRGWFMAEDRLACSLLASDRVDRLLVSDTRKLPLQALRTGLAAAGTAFPESERARLVEPLRLSPRDPSSIRGVTRAFAAYDRALRRAALDMGLVDPVVITAHPLVAGFAELSWSRAVTWYAIDDWAEHPAYRRWWRAYRESYARVRARGRRVAAVSPALLDRVAPTGPSMLIPNGLEPAEWLGEVEVPVWVGGLPRPLLVYAGALDSRIDVEWMLSLAREMPEATILLVGPLAEPGHLAPLRNARNIHFRPPLERGQISGLIRAADVGLLPHIRSRLTEAMSPLKLYEYLAGGLPVAATDLRPVRGVDARVVLVPPGGDFAAAVRVALERGRAREAERLAFIEANSWRARHDALLDLALSCSE